MGFINQLITGGHHPVWIIIGYPNRHPGAGFRNHSSYRYLISQGFPSHFRNIQNPSVIPFNPGWLTTGFPVLGLQYMILESSTPKIGV